ncbi:MAG TPA: WSC domain-containing protein [Thermoanaerobaculia bacterium]|nr:WSC domain-containing protein [Thermoanaerobaculia bacterium]
MDLLLAITPASASADDFKRQICAIGINLGSIASREYLFGRQFSNSQPPADQVNAIADAVNKTLGHTSAAERLIGAVQPASRPAMVRQFAAEVSAYMTTRRSLTYSQRENRVSNLASTYRRSLEWTFNSSRPDAFQYNSTCFSALFTACYEFGYAGTAAAVGDARSEGAHVIAMRNAIDSGMQIAYDREDYSDAKQICCNMGTKAQWAPILGMTGTSPHSAFVINTTAIQEIALSIPRAHCNGSQPRNYVGCFAESRNADVTGLGNRVLGGAMIPNDPGMNVEKCVSFCASKGYAYAGLQYAAWCFCGNSYATEGSADNCNMACSGNGAEACGGPWANSVYRTSPR